MTFEKGCGISSRRPPPHLHPGIRLEKIRHRPYRLRQ